MPYQVAFEASEESERELKEKGFEKKEVWVKSFSGKSVNSDKACEEGNSDFFQMENPPYQFITTSWWGMGQDT